MDKKEYIERVAAMDVVKRTSGDYAAAWAEIAHIPAADVVEVRHGTWTDIGSLSCRCSECGCKNNRTTPYCPLCGARMDKEDEHEAD